MRRNLTFALLGLIVALAVGWLAFPAALYERADQPLQFSHALHTGGDVGLTCADCHGFDPDGRFEGVPSLARCTGCHEQAQGETADEKRFVDEYVSHGREVPWRVYARQPANVHFPHAVHVRLAGIACERCHGGHGATTGLRRFERNRLSGYSRDIWGHSLTRAGRPAGDGMKMSDCEGCHRERAVTSSCLTCHK
jgi:hypothetical protein